MKKAILILAFAACTIFTNSAFARYWPTSYDNGNNSLNNLTIESEYTFKHYFDAANNGDIDAQYTIGGMYLSGINVQKDVSKAVGWLTLAAEANQLDAQQLLAKLYFLGDYLERNDALAYKWLSILGARNLWLRSLMNTCKKQIDSESIELGKKLAKEWLDRWYEKCNSDPNCTFEAFEETIGINMFYPNKQTASIINTQIPTQESPFNLSGEYGLVRRDFGETPLTKSITEALSDEKQLADTIIGLAQSGDVSSQLRAAVFYFYGTGYPEDNLKSLKWFRIAADNGNADAQFCLGRMHLIGIGLVQDPQKAVEYLTKAANNCQIDAQYLLAKSYFEGKDLPKNDSEAFKWISIMVLKDERAITVRDNCRSLISVESAEKGQLLKANWLRNR